MKTLKSIIGLFFLVLFLTSLTSYSVKAQEEIRQSEKLQDSKDEKFILKTITNGLTLPEGDPVNKTVGLRFYIRVNGAFPTEASGPNEDVLEAIALYAGSHIDYDDWLPCEGQTLMIASNSALFNLMGTTYGGNGTSTFQLPDLRYAIPIHNRPIIE